MRPELERIRLIEDYLHRRLSPAQTAELEVRLLTEPELYDELVSQKQVYRLLQVSGRRQLRSELEYIHQRLYGQSTHPWLYILVGSLALAAGYWLIG